MATSARIRPKDLPDFLLASGERIVSTERVSELLGVRPGRVSRSLAAPRRDHRIVSVTKGAWAPVRPGWRRMGTDPPAEYIDDLMALLGHRHYVAYRSAAAVYGVSHHSFQGLQVAVDAYCRDRWIGDVPLRFVRSSRVGSVPTRLRRFGTAQVTVSTPEATVLDLMERPDLGGGLGYVANAMGDMLAFGLLDAEALAALSGLYARSVVQRAGHVLGRMQHDLDWAINKPLDLGPLEDALASRGMRTVALTARRATQLPQAAGEAPVDRRWQVAVDCEIEHDL